MIKLFRMCGRHQAGGAYAAVFCFDSRWIVIEAAPPSRQETIDGAAQGSSG